MLKTMNLRMILTAIVCTGVFYTSFAHITTVAQSYGNSLSTALMYPILIDGMILACALTLTAKTGVNKMTRWYAGLGRWTGFGFTIACNTMHANSWNVGAIFVALIPAIVLIIVVELLIHAAQGTPATRAKRATKSTTTQASNVRSIRKAV